MFSRVRALPFLRSRSNVEFGVYLAVLWKVGLAVALTALMPDEFRRVSSQLLEAFAGVGSAVFIAYTVGVSRLFRDMRRGSDSEVLLGSLVGLAICGILGVGLTLILIDARQPLFHHFRAFWAVGSQVLLAGLVASLPLFAYEVGRTRHLNPDE